MSPQDSQDENNTCPRCGENYVDKLDMHDAFYRTPGQIDDFWAICTWEGEAYIHDIGVNDWDGVSDHSGGAFDNAE